MATRRLAWICLSVLAFLAPGAAKSISVANLEKLSKAVQAKFPGSSSVTKLGEITRTLQIATPAPANAAAQTSCAFSLLQAINFLARSVFQLRGIVIFCPEAAKATKPMKTCLISSSALVASMAQIAAGISVAVSKCAATVNNKALCAAPIASWFAPVSLFISAGTTTSASCANQVAALPKELELHRRLESVNDRKWSLAECAVDVTSAIMAVGQIAIGFNGATTSCPAVTGQPLQEKVSKAACWVDAGFMVFSVSRLVLFLALAAAHCTVGPQPDATCVAAADTLVAAALAATFLGPSVYLSCQVGPEKSKIIDGTSVLLNRRRLSSRDDLIGALSKQAGFNRRLTPSDVIAELANQSAFETVDDLWLSMGYNLSDPNAAWLEEDPEETAVINKGRQMLKELQTTREEPPKELLEYSPEEAPPMTVPEVLIDPQDDASTLSCSEKDVVYMLDLPGHAVSLEQGVAACQARCARAPGCARFSYWPPQRHCHLHGILAEPVPGQPLWISGPPGCKGSQVSNATRRTMARKLTCYHPHAVYEPRDTLAEPQLTSSIEDCQRRCQQTQGCAHFVYSELDGRCSLADVTAVKLQPVLYSVAGPRHCPDTKLVFPGHAAGASTMFERQAGPITFPRAGYPAWGITGAVCAVSGAALVFWASLTASRRAYQGIVQSEPAMHSEPILA